MPENTLPSFERAINIGCNWVELDVYAVENQLLVIHDSTVDRTTNGKGEISSLSFEDLRKLDAGNGYPIPTLQEVINLVDRRCRINIELKGPDTAQPVCDLLGKYCLGQWTHSDFLLSSFDHNELEKADPAYPRGALFSKLVSDLWTRAERLGAWSVNFDKRDVNEALVTEAHARGYKILVYTVNSKTAIRKLLDYGVDGIFSDFPDRVLDVMADRRQ